MQYKMKNSKKGYIWIVRVILIVLIIMWMSTIFGFSAEDGEQSQSFSDRITIKVVKILKSDYDSLNSDKQEEFFNKVSFAVRKTGHFGEYGILGILFACLLMTFEKVRKYNKKEMKLIFMTAAICMIYAATDEFHQGFVAGRSSGVWDVVIDTLGGTVGAAMVSVVALFVAKKRNA